ncbi:MAG: GNAT family N-acetyltransferase [Halorhabdus sp.]
MTTTIDTATQRDVAALTDLWVALVEDQRAHGAHLYGETNRGRAREFIANAVTNDGVLVARDGGLIGFVMFRNETGAYEQDVTRGVIDNVFVCPARRGEGVGTRLMDAAEAALAERGAELVTLSVLADNDAARRFYDRRGYEPHRIELERRSESDTPSKED